MQKDKRLSEIDRKLGIILIPCRKCKFEFHTLHKEDIYCPCCETGGFKNPERDIKKGRR